MYWYISGSKVLTLNEGGRARLGQVRLKLGAFGVEAEAEGKADSGDRVQGALKRVRRRLEKDDSVLSFDELVDAQAVFSFCGAAAVAQDGVRFLMAVRGERHALSLVGSAGNIVGQAPQHVTISPSAMPALAAAGFSGGEFSQDEASGTSLSYEWQLVMRRAGGGRAVLPIVRGFAVFGGLYPASKKQLRRVGAGHLTSIVVGSPIYVEQS